jgi:hypothetical protein
MTVECREVYTLEYSKHGPGHHKDGKIQVCIRVLHSTAEGRRIKKNRFHRVSPLSRLQVLLHARGLTPLQAIAEFDMSLCSVVLQPTAPPPGADWSPTRDFTVRLSNAAAWHAMQRTCSTNAATLCSRSHRPLSRLANRLWYVMQRRSLYVPFSSGNALTVG